MKAEVKKTCEREHCDQAENICPDTGLCEDCHFLLWEAERDEK